MEFLASIMNEQIKAEKNMNSWKSGKGMINAKCSVKKMNCIASLMARSETAHLAEHCTKK